MTADVKRGKRRHIPDEVRIPIRVVEYRITNRESVETIRLITTLADHESSVATSPVARQGHDRCDPHSRHMAMYALAVGRFPGSSTIFT